MTNGSELAIIFLFDETYKYLHIVRFFSFSEAPNTGLIKNWAFSKESGTTEENIAICIYLQIK